MAIQISKSVIEHQRPMKLASTVTVALERGMIMSYVNDGGELAVRPCAAAAGERVAGVLWLSEISETEIPFAEQKVVPAVGPFTVVLKNIPVSGSVGIVTSTGTVLATPADFTVAGNVVTFVLGGPAALAGGEAVTISYRRAITAAELGLIAGQRSVNNGVEGQYREVTIGYGNCDVKLSNFDTSVASTYVPMASVLTAADGRFSTAGGGTAFGRVSSAPALDLSPGIEQLFVGVVFNAPLV